ncbi:unnamed protein product [Nesidiocoris tenuis]|uniref:Uncharacterized protein n=1 Tax=Nesidiocoris tenuis TaxID=355587 RepID=A0A6H5GAQ2_9HEMI|nr:unnamed protein product [Nesidiocoris tenuis]
MELDQFHARVWILVVSARALILLTEHKSVRATDTGVSILPTATSDRARPYGA